MTGLIKTQAKAGNCGPSTFFFYPRSVAYCQTNDKFYNTDLTGNGRIIMTDGHLRRVEKTLNGSEDDWTMSLQSVSCNDTYVYVSVVGT
jgi:hypothetical protein